jgi:tetratricopeptide (TPR) repeat protein
MKTFANAHAARFLQLADRFVDAGSPLDAIHCAERAVKLDPSLWGRSGPVIRAAADCTLSTLQRRGDDLCRMRRHLQKLEMIASLEDEVHDSLCRLPAGLETAGEASPQPLPPALQDDLQRLDRVLNHRSDAVSDRARRTIRSLLPACAAGGHTASEPPHHAPESPADRPFWEFLSVEHELHNAGNDLYKLQRFEDAITLYDLALDIRPDLLETYFNRGLAYTRISRYDLAEADLGQVIQLNPNLAEAFYTRGLVHEYRQDYEAAIADYDQALRIDPEYHKAEDQRRIAREKRTGAGRANQEKRDSDEYDGVVKDYSPYRVKPDCNFSQVGDHAAIKREFGKILTYMRGGQILVEWGGELPRGVLLYGESGVGKTHLARSLAGEANCPFYAPPMSVILDMYVGNSEKNLRNLFQAAAQHEKAIVFLDEMDVVASLRKESRQAHEPWHARLAACLLEEMDNLANRNRGVVVIGATNCLEAVDPAFLRPGRFTYVIEVPPPNEIGLAEILLVCLETASLRAKRHDFLDPQLEQAVLATRREWLERAFQHDGTGLVEVARIAATKEMVGDDIREIVRRAIDERIIAGIDGIDLGPISVPDLLRHVRDYTVVRKD